MNCNILVSNIEGECEKPFLIILKSKKKLPGSLEREFNFKVKYKFPDFLKDGGDGFGVFIELENLNINVLGVGHKVIVIRIVDINSLFQILI